MQITKTYLKDLTYQINGACIEVHKSLGPGLLESVYHKCLKHELEIRKISFLSEQRVAIQYKGLILDSDLKYDLFVENIMTVELKAVELILPVHKAQTLTYMKLLEAPKGILVNFNVDHLFNDGIQTFVNEYFRLLPE